MKPTAPQKLTNLLGVGQVLADRIRRHLGDNDEARALSVIERNPYSLLDVPRVGFKTADKIAQAHYQIDPQHEGRHEAGNRYLLADKGSLERREFDTARQNAGLLGIQHRFTGVTFDEGRVWLPSVLAAEKAIAAWTLNLPLDLALPGLTGRVTEAEERALARLDELQRKAALNAVRGPNKVLGITGGAGTGKTHVTSSIALLAENQGKAVAVLTPTGKAADRAREALLKAGAFADAMTIHRALGYPRMTTAELPYDLVILDECSMVSVDLLWEVVKRLSRGARLILVGDPGQLPPVGHGQPFTDLLDLGLPRIHLETNHRQKDVQGIIHLAEGIRRRVQPKDIDDGSVELTLLNGDAMDTAATATIQAKRGQPLEQWQIITWMNEDAHALNEGTQEELNPDGMPVFTYRPYGWMQDIEVRAGDKVVVKTNDPDYGVFNGQIGFIRDLQLKELRVRRVAKTLEEFTDADEEGYVTDKRMTEVAVLEIGGQQIDMPVVDAKDLLLLGYAITVHKAQGSDWEHVLLMQPREIGFDAARWWYTSVTRARSKLSVFYTCKSPLKFWMNVRRSLMQEETTLVRRFRKLLNERSVNGLQLDLGLQTPEQVTAAGQGWLE